MTYTMLFLLTAGSLNIIAYYVNYNWSFIYNTILTKRWRQINWMIDIIT